MLRTLVLALICACFVTSGAHARSRHGHVSEAGIPVSGCSDPVMRPCGVGFANGISGEEINPKSLRRRHFHTDSRRKEITARGHRLKVLKRLAFHPKSDDLGSTPWNTVSRPARYIAGRLVCAVNVNAELARRGIRGTGSALAKSFLRWGRASRPVAGAVAVYGRRGGGHVAIVSRVVNGRVYVWNPSSRSHRWREVEYRKRAIAYRVAGW